MLKGIPDDRDGLFDTIQRSKNHYQKRAYQCIKCMVALFSNCSVAYQILQVRSPAPCSPLVTTPAVHAAALLAHYALVVLACVHRATAT